jgi:hypothetical protein
MKGLIAAACLCLFAFAVARAVRVSLTFDEAAAFLRYIATDVPSVFNTDVLSIFNFEVATNHLLNTVLTKLCVVAAGDSELALRFPSLAGYAMYLGFSVLILRRFTRGPIALAGLLLLNLNPYLFDFFALSRGYGLSLGFMMGALFFLFCLLEQLRNHAPAARDLSRALLFASGAVMASFAMLNVYVAIWAISLATLAVSHSVNRRVDAPLARDEHTQPSERRSYAWLMLVASVFTAVVFSQAIALSESLYEPVQVRLYGLNDSELAAVTISRADIRGRQTPLARDPGTAVWQAPDRGHFRHVQIEMPIEAAGRLARIDVVVGRRAFSHLPGQAEAWSSSDVDATRVLESGVSLATPRSRMPAFRPVMNWAGDARYARSVAGYTAVALLVLAALAFLLRAAGGLAVRARLLTLEEWRPLARSVLWIAALAGPPLYLLESESELYFGGTHGLIEDTFYSLIRNSFYGRTYHPLQTQIVFVATLASLAAFGIAAFAGYRQRKLPALLNAACLAAIMVITSLSLVAQRFMFNTVYLTGRTALLFIPLYILFLTLLCQALFTFGRVGKIAAASILVTAVGLSACHFTTTANLKYTWDWPDDAATKDMMGDLAFVIAAEHASRSRTILGVDWIYAPAAVYYAHRHQGAGIDIVVAPFRSPPDFLYVEEKHARPPIHVLRRYRAAHSVLARDGATR